MTDGRLITLKWGWNPASGLCAKLIRGQSAFIASSTALKERHAQIEGGRWTDCWEAATSRCSENHTTRAFYPLELTVISTFAPVPPEPTNAHTVSILQHGPCCCVQEKSRISECECCELNIQWTPPVNQSWCQPGNITNMPDPAHFPLCSSRFFPFLPLFQVPTPPNGWCFISPAP